MERSEKRISPPNIYERLVKVEPQTLKRARRLLNPLDDHPLLHTLADYEQLSDFLKTNTLPFDYPLNSELNAIKGAEFTKRVKEAEKKKKGTALKHAERQAKYGVGELKKIVKDHLDNPSDTQSEHPQEKQHLFAGIRHTELHRHGQQPPLRDTLQLINTLTHEIDRKDEIDEAHGTDHYSPKQKLALVTAGIGFAQTVAVNELNVRQHKKRKHAMYDQILVYSLQVLTKNGHQDIAEYMIGQKAAQLLLE